MSATATDEKQTPTFGDFGKGLRDYQKQVIEFQKSAFDSTFDTFATFQEQQGQFFADIVERANGVPDEGKQLVGQWIDTFRRGREDYKSAVDKSYELMLGYFDRVGETTGETTEG